ncbi:hypothetical protein GCM10017772_39160 [Promicromonospora soli]|uniref:Uncharacterized protein n=1 Tax=Promicromonospora soli TaxID=2035533 RepID=A0A919G5D5_9MICO|nr:hypothetical protein GCM10017772_39160 [Promicromonospora soli]
MVGDRHPDTDADQGGQHTGGRAKEEAFHAADSRPQQPGFVLKTGNKPDLFMRSIGGMSISPARLERTDYCPVPDAEVRAGPRSRYSVLSVRSRRSWIGSRDAAHPAPYEWRTT